MPCSMATVSWKAHRGAPDSSRFSAFRGGDMRQNDLSAFGAAGHCSEVMITDKSPMKRKVEIELSIVEE